MSLPNLNGRVAWIFAEDNFDVDQIVGVKNIKLTDIEQLAALAMQQFDPDFRNVVRKGDIIIGGRNFGYAAGFGGFFACCIDTWNMKTSISRS